MFEACNPSPHCPLESDLLAWRTVGLAQSQGFFLERIKGKELIDESAITLDVRRHRVRALVWRAADA